RAAAGPARRQAARRAARARHRRPEAQRPGGAAAARRVDARRPRPRPMIERLLAADAALERDDLDAAARLFGQVAEADPRNAIAAVGLGKVAAARDDADGARTWFRRALEIDPHEAAARRLLAALDREVPEGVPAQPEGAPPVAGPRPRLSALDRILGWL